MNSTIIVALISLVGTIMGSLGGILVSSKLTNYRIEQLEKKVDKHNNFAEKIPILKTKIDMLNQRIKELEYVSALIINVPISNSFANLIKCSFLNVNIFFTPLKSFLNFFMLSTKIKCYDGCKNHLKLFWWYFVL